jgi:L-ribulose-5-phosphate 4-epimerase
MYRLEKEEILRTARKLQSEGIIKLSAGNLSVRRGEHVIVTPSGMDYEGLDSSDMVVVDLKGNVVEGERKPSLDTVGLLYIYNHISRIQALIHTHQVYATAVSLIADRIPAMLTPQVNTLKGDVPVTRFAPAGKVETGIVTVESIGDRNAVILRQHGVMAAGKDLKEALYAIVYLEEAAQAYLMARAIGTPATLDDGQIREAINIFVGYIK